MKYGALFSATRRDGAGFPDCLAVCRLSTLSTFLDLIMPLPSLPSQ
jgi:hypothetical protein